MTRILFLLNGLQMGGAENVTLRLIENLDRSRFAPFLVTFDQNGPWRGRVPAGVPLLELGDHRLRKNFPRLVAALWRTRPQVVFASHSNCAHLLWLARWLVFPRYRMVFRCPWVKAPGTDFDQWYPGAADVLHYQRRAYPKAAAIVAQSAAMGDILRQTLSLRQGQVRVIGNPLDMAQLAALGQTAPDPFSGPGPHLLYVGRLDALKDLPTLFSAFETVHRETGADLTLVGSGPEEKKLRALAAGLGPAGRAIVFVGEQENPYPWFAHATLFVMSSLTDSFPNALLEAHAFGLPSVSTDCPHGPAAIIQPEKTGLLTPVGNPAAFAQACLRLLRHEMPFDREAALAVARRHDIKTIIPQYEALFAEVAGGRP